MLIRELAQQAKCVYIGDDFAEVYSLKYAGEADENSLAVAFSSKDVRGTKAFAVLAEPSIPAGERVRLYPRAKNVVYCNTGGFHGAILRVARAMIDAGIYYDYEQPFAQYEKGGVCYGINVSVGEGTFISPLVYIGENVQIGSDCVIESGVFIGSNTAIGDGVIIRAGSRIGVNCNYHCKCGSWYRNFCGVGRLIIGNEVEIGANTVIQHGTLSDTIIGNGTVIGNLVEIAHDVKIGAGCLIISQVGICGNVTIGDGVQVYGQAGIANFVKIGDGAVILAKSAVTKDVRAGQKISGIFGRDHAAELKNLARFRRLGNG